MERNHEHLLGAIGTLVAQLDSSRAVTWQKSNCCGAAELARIAQDVGVSAPRAAHACRQMAGCGRPAQSQRWRRSARSGRSSQASSRGAARPAARLRDVLGEGAVRVTISSAIRAIRRGATIARMSRRSMRCAEERDRRSIGGAMDMEPMLTLPVRLLIVAAVVCARAASRSAIARRAARA